MKYVVTGAAGFIGSHLTKQLLMRGDEVLALDSFTDYYDPALKEENSATFSVEKIDIADADLDLSSFDGVFHLAAQPGVRPSFDRLDIYLRSNVLATQRVIASATQAGVRVILASSSSVYGEAEVYPTPEDTELRPLSPYGITKLAAEHLVHAYACDAAILRFLPSTGRSSGRTWAFPCSSMRF